MKPLQQKSAWLSYLVKMLVSQKAQWQVMQNVRVSTIKRTRSLLRWLIQGLILFLASPWIILFATPVNAFPLIARQRKEGTWTYSFAEFSAFQNRARLLFVLVLLGSLIVELILFLR